MAPAGQCGWWLVAAPPPSPSHPSTEKWLIKWPWSPGWKAWLEFFACWTGWGSGVALL